MAKTRTTIVVGLCLLAIALIGCSAPAPAPQAVVPESTDPTKPAAAPMLNAGELKVARQFGEDFLNALIVAHDRPTASSKLTPECKKVLGAELLAQAIRLNMASAFDREQGWRESDVHVALENLGQNWSSWSIDAESLSPSTREVAFLGKLQPSKLGMKSGGGSGTFTLRVLKEETTSRWRIDGIAIVNKSESN